MLELMLAMAFIMIITWSKGKNHTSSPELIPVTLPSTVQSAGGGVALEGQVITVTPRGYLLNGSLLNREELMKRVSESDSPRFYVHPDQDAMDENLRWLLAGGGISDNEKFEFFLAL